MKAFDLPEANFALAKDQPEYNTLFVAVDFGSPQRKMTFGFDLTDEEIEQIVKNKKLYVEQVTFGNLFQPMSIHTTNPIPDAMTEFEPPIDENRVSVEEWDSTHYMNNKETKTVNPDGGNCVNCGKDWQQHFFSTRQCELTNSFLESLKKVE